VSDSVSLHLCTRVCVYLPPGNGQSDKPGLFSGHSRWWTIDDHVEKDVPALIRYVTKQTNTTQVRGQPSQGWVKGGWAG
jgi:hypothetical protein